MVMSTEKISRRSYLKWVGAGVVAVAVAGAGYGAYQYLVPRPKEPLVVVQWGGPDIEAQRPIAAEFTSQTGIPIVEELHTGGSAAVIARIKASLPEMTRHVIAAWDPVWAGLDKEGWLAPWTPDKVPVMAEYPDSAKFVGPTSNQVVALGWHVATTNWFYREDLFPKDLQPFDDFNKLLDPRLKGKVMISDMVNGTGACVWTIARAMGGDEKNMEAGWSFLKKLAEAGQIGGIFSAGAEAISDLTAGNRWIVVAPTLLASSMYKSGVPLKWDKTENIKVPYDLEGFCVTKSKREEDAFKWINFFYQAGNDEKFTQALGTPPTHPKAKTGPEVWNFYPRPEELPKYGYTPDFDYCFSKLDEWQTRFEAEILPLIKASG